MAGGEGGLDKIQQMLEQMTGRFDYGGSFLLEIGQGQGEMVTSLIKSYFPQVSIELISDLGSIERVVKVILWEGMT